MKEPTGAIDDNRPGQSSDRMTADVNRQLWIFFSARAIRTAKMAEWIFPVLNSTLKMNTGSLS